MSWNHVETLAGATAATACVYTGLPFDTVKLRLQTQTASAAQQGSYSGPIDCVRKIVRAEGVGALWKGATPAVASACVENAVVFTFNGISKRFLMNTFGDGDVASSPQFGFISGGIAGFSPQQLCALLKS